MSHISDLDPCGLLFLSGHTLLFGVCVVACADGRSTNSQSNTL